MDQRVQKVSSNLVLPQQQHVSSACQLRVGYFDPRQAFTSFTCVVAGPKSLEFACQIKQIRLLCPSDQMEEPQKPVQAQINRLSREGRTTNGLYPSDLTANGLASPVVFSGNTPGSERSAANESHLEQLLAVEREDKQTFITKFRQMRAKFESAVTTQAKLEQELVARDEKIDGLQSDVRKLRKGLESKEDELANMTKEFLNTQTKWLTEAEELNDEIRALKVRNKKLEASNGTIGDYSMSQHDRSASLSSLDPSLSMSPGSISATSTPKSRNVSVDYRTPGLDGLSVDDVHKSILFKELVQRHEQVKKELQDMTELKLRLEDENENFQLLIAGRTVSGELTLEEELEQASSLSQSENHSGVGEDHEQGTLQEPVEELRRLRFEKESLQNHNRALYTSMERLVHRLLQDKEFSRAVRETVSSDRITEFSQRVTSLNEQTLKHYRYKDSVKQRGSAPSRDNWTRMLFACGSTNPSSPGTRAVSLGVDDFIDEKGFSRRASSPQSRPRTPIEPSDVSTNSESDSMSGTKTLSPSSEREFPLLVPKRTVAQTSLRKLRLTS